MLQIVNGESYMDNFQLKIRKEVAIPSTRGNIYDRNGNVLAFNELSYSVTIKDIFEDSGKNQKLNATILEIIDIIEESGDHITTSFDIALENGDYVFTSSGNTSKLRFLADIYGRISTDDLLYDEKNKTAHQVIEDLARRYGIGKYSEPDESGKRTFLVGEGYDLDSRRLLELISVRYRLSLNSYQKYLSTVIAENISDKTVARILESSNTLQGVDVEERTQRRYTDSKYFSHILGYTGLISTEELESFKILDPQYDNTDSVGKLGIEKSQDIELQGKKGTNVVYVDSLGKQLSVEEVIAPIAGNDIYLTIDRDLQIAAYDLLEKRLSSILLAKIRNIKEYYKTEEETGSDIILPIYDVYHAIFKNVIDLDHLASEDAGETEKRVYAQYSAYLDNVMNFMDYELKQGRTPYKKLEKEFKIYQSFIIQYLYNNKIIDSSKIDTDDPTYINWTNREIISMGEYIEYCIYANWVNSSKLDLEGKYTDSSTVYESICKYLMENLPKDKDFTKKIYKYMLLNDVIAPEDTCRLLMEQGIVDVSPLENTQFEQGTISAYSFMLNRIANMDLTPAMLSLDPCSGSMVVTDPTNGDVLALVTYPGYDNNMMANGVDADYYESLRNDASMPLINYATQQRTAPGSTFKMVTATAGLSEGVISLGETLVCTGTYTRVTPNPHCWIYPDGSHGWLNVSGAIRNSCNNYFYEVGFRLGMLNGYSYDSDIGIEALAEYADMYGLSDCSGIEIEEASPLVSTEDAVRSAIGQGSSGYTTAQLARYVTTVANSGTCYNLTMIDHMVDTSTGADIENSANIRNTIQMDNENWDAIHKGMRMVVQDKAYFASFKVAVAGKTGTAQENLSRPNHALFICYAPYDSPNIAIATRIANGYSSDYAARLARDVLSYYYGMETLEELMNNTDEVEAKIGGD